MSYDIVLVLKPNPLPNSTSQTKKVEMKTIDSVISRKNKNGEKVSLSNKCAEMDREV